MLDQAETEPGRTTDLEHSEAEPFYDVPEKLNAFQWGCVGFLYLVLLSLVAFIIYISCTWNKIRINEYT